jgi:arsenate reductase
VDRARRPGGACGDARQGAAVRGTGLAGLDDGALLDAMLAHPILIERPFVVTPLGVRLCRPKERVFEILPEAAPL